jgi:hypothetical protein
MFAIGLQNRCLTVVLTVAAFALALIGNASAEPYSHAPVTEYIRLPKFCWGQFNDKLQGQEFWFYGCGVGANHYCEGLLNLENSKRIKNMDQKKVMLQKAKQDTAYTLGWLERQQVMGSCSITAHVQATMKEIELQYQIYHIK